MQDIPQQFREFADSNELGEIVETIGKKYNLTIDKIGELDAEIRDILVGTTPSKGFVEDIIERCEIDKKTAEQIVTDVNSQVFQMLKTRLQVNKQASIESIEQAGDFNIVPEAKEAPSKVGPEDKAKVLSDLEHPPQNTLPKGPDAYRESV